MKSNLKLFGIITLAVMIVFTASCKGPMGPMGPEGPEGPRGGSGSGGSGGSDGQDGKDGENGSDLTFYTITYDTGEEGSYVIPDKWIEGTTARTPEAIPTRPIDITDLEPGLYRSWGGGWLFKGWFLNGVRYNFDQPVTSNITLTASWGAPGLVTEDEIGRNPDDSDFIVEALKYIAKDPRGYLLILGADYTVNSALPLKGSDTQLVIRGKDAQRTITRGATGDGLLFDVDNAAMLTLQENVTLRGSQTASNSLVKVQNISYITMEEGSKITGHKTSSVNGAVYVHAMSRFYMNGGEVSDNEVTAVDGQGGGVYIGLNSEFTMEGGKISGNKLTGTSTSPSSTGAGGGGGMYCFTGSNITINGGEISENTASGSGGGVYVTRGTLTINAGKISGNTTNGHGGGMYIADALLTMTGGEISGNISNSNGGGIYTTRTPFTMTGGKISGNTASIGGGVTTNNTFTMTGGEISGNTATTTSANAGGGGVDFSGGGNGLMTGGKISGNISNSTGGGVSIRGISCSLTINGGEISGNTAAAANSGSVHSGNGTLTINGGEINAGTGIGVSVNGGKFTMNGGTITSSNVKGQVYVNDNAASGITLAGTASLTKLTYANTELPIYIASGWTGSVTNLNLYNNNSGMGTVISVWANVQAVQGVTGYTLTAADITKFTNCFFMNSADTTYDLKAGFYTLSKAGSIGKVVLE
jgi:hypothetical protein